MGRFHLPACAIPHYAVAAESLRFATRGVISTRVDCVAPIEKREKKWFFRVVARDSTYGAASGEGAPNFRGIRNSRWNGSIVSLTAEAGLGFSAAL